MPIKQYIALTSAEFAAVKELPMRPAWMACHFSCYSTGLTNIPKALPEGAMVIVNDRTPVQGHDPKRILEQLLDLWETAKPECFLLDLQRPEVEETARIAQLLTQELPCPVGVTPQYAVPLACPVLLPPPGLTRSLQEHLLPWDGRELWLELATDAGVATITKDGCCFSQAGTQIPDSPAFFDQGVCCRYQTAVGDDSVTFYLQRKNQDLKALAQAAEALGVTRTVGLYQQLGSGQ